MARPTASRRPWRRVFEEWIRSKKTIGSCEVNTLLTLKPTKNDLRAEAPLFLTSPAALSPKTSIWRRCRLVKRPSIIASVCYDEETGCYDFYAKANEHAARAWFDMNIELSPSVAVLRKNGEAPSRSKRVGCRRRMC